MSSDHRRPARGRKPKIGRKRRAPPGAPPGTLIPDPAASAPAIRFIGYGPDDLEEREISKFEELEALTGKWPVIWINVDGLADVELIRRLGQMFGLHRLALEDVINVHQRPKVEEYEDHVFMVTRMIHDGHELTTEQVSLFLGADFVLTFQERPGDCLDPVRDRIRRSHGIIRAQQADYLAYALLDAVIDGYFPVLEGFGERLERLEETVVGQPHGAHAVEIHDMKRDLLTLRRAVWPQREMMNTLSRETLPQLSQRTRVYLRDCYDHAIQLMDLIETYREIASGLLDVYLSSVSARMNEVMKVLTIIATIFIPLTFISGLYGMNFRSEVSPWNMPELSWYWGYPFALGLMAAVAIGLLLLFRRIGWIGRERRARPPPR